MTPLRLPGRLAREWSNAPFCVIAPAPKRLIRNVRELSALLAVLLVSVFQLGAYAQRARPEQGPITVDLTGPLILGFFPPFTEAEAAEDRIIEGLAHVRFALEDISRCYKNDSATYRLDVTRSVTLREGQGTHRIDIPGDSEHAVGIILAMPGQPPRTIFATDGPSTLGGLGPLAAADYFGEPGCQRNR
jgi:hypothetical protein